MGGVYCQLDELKLGRMLREESEVKTEFSVSLREARVGKGQQGKLELDKLAEDIFKVRELYEEVQSSLHRKELLFDQISCSNEKIQAEYNEKMLKLEGENKDLTLSSDEAFARIHDLEKKTAANSEEISGLKRLVSVMQKNASVDQKESDEESRFSRIESEWEREKSSLLDEISSLRGFLDGRIRDEERAKFELQSKASEVVKMKIALQRSERELEILRLNSIQNQQACLLAALNDKDAQIVNLGQQTARLRSVILAKSEAVEMLILEKDSHFRLAEDRNCIIKDLQNEVDQLRNKLADREVTCVDIFDANNTLRHENEMLISSIKEFESLDQNFKSAVISLAKKDADSEEAEGPKIVEVAEQNRVIANLEKETNRLCKVQEKSLLHFPEQTKKPEIEELRSQLEKETRLFENLLEELESHKHVLLKDRTNIDKVSAAQLETLFQQIGFLCSEDLRLMAMVGKLSPFNEEESEPTSNTFSPSRKYVQVSLDARTPLAELNS